MGNAPLSSPPRPSAHRVVMPIMTKRRFGTKLSILPLFRYDDPAPTESAGSGVSLTTASTSASRSTTAQTSNTSSPDSNVVVMDSGCELHDESFPKQFNTGPISREEYNEKMQQLRERLDEWKGGRATVAILTIALFILVAFFAAYFTPHFWSSPLFDHPGYIVAMAVTITSVFYLLYRCSRRESQKLVADVEDLYRPWRGRGVHVTMKRYANVAQSIPYVQRSSRAMHGGGQPTSGSNCYCVVMTLVDENEEDAQDNVSTGTIMTDASRESGSGDEVNEEGEVNAADDVV